MATTSHVYAYPFASSFAGADSRRLSLATSTTAVRSAPSVPGDGGPGPTGSSLFFVGRLVRPDLAAALLRALSVVSQTRFYAPPAMVKKKIAAQDPVITSGGERLRLEAFSPCCGAYARVDLAPSAFEGEWMGTGTTNVNFNAPMLDALSAVRASDTVELKVGADRFELHAARGTAIEHKVPLPDRWLKAFVEVQQFRSEGTVLTSTGPAAVELIASVPRQVTRGVTTYLAPGGGLEGRGALRLSLQERPGSIRVGGPGRLKVLTPLAPLAHALVVRGAADGTSSFTLELDGARFHLVLSPDASRGFSGEGKVLELLASGSGRSDVAEVRAALRWQARIEPEALAARLGRNAAVVRDALLVLGTRGLVGWDVSEGAYFHRELPFDRSRVESLEPRLEGARDLAEKGAVRVESRAAGAIEAYVQGRTVAHRVRSEGDRLRCTCPWFARYQGQRGPCKHALAVQLALQEDR